MYKYNSPLRLNLQQPAEGSTSMMASGKNRQRPELLTVAETAAELGVRPKTIRRWIVLGRFTRVQPYGPGGAYRILSAEVDQIWERIKREP